MAESTFVQVLYIRTTPEKLWWALTDKEFIQQWWFGVRCESQWKAGSTWQLVYADGTLTDDGTILEAEPPRRLVIRWRHEHNPELSAEGESRCTMELAPIQSAVKLSLTHTIGHEPSKLIAALSNAWPMALSNLKSLLENGTVVLDTHP
jgi:uncharacterized protein YndB with AHSA1/START domain